MEPTLVALCVAVGIGLLVGAERERRKNSSPDKGSAGIRTFAIAAIMGAVGMLIGGVAVLALLLFARNAIHHFVRALLAEQDWRDALVFAAIALIVMPLAPDQFMGPFNALNPRSLVLLVVVMLGISACGYVGSRWFGPRYGLPLAGFSSGFVSSAATIHSMGQRAREVGASSGAEVAGAALSSIATFVQMAVLIGLVEPQLLRDLALPLLLGGAAALAYGAYCLRGMATAAAGSAPGPQVGRAFELKTALAFAAVLTLVMLVSAGLNVWLGERGVALAAFVAGLADAHAIAASTASLIAAGEIQVQQAVMPILLGITANTVTKAVVAYQGGGAGFLWRLAPGLGLMLAAVWVGYGLTSWFH